MYKITSVMGTFSSYPPPHTHSNMPHKPQKDI